jgi:hypothetical protein
MMLKWKIIGFGICLLIALTIVGFFSGMLPPLPSFGDRRDPVPSTLSGLHLTEDALALWIYQQSNRISILTAREIAREAIKTEIPFFILGLIMAESEFVPTAVSSKGAIGLTQVRFEVHGKELMRVGLIKEKRDLFDIGPSIRSGNFIFKMYLKQSGGNAEKAMELYLGGKDGFYVKKISLNLLNLYVLGGTQERKQGGQSDVLPLKEGVQKRPD